MAQKRPKYELKSLLITRKDYETLREQWRPCFSHGIRRLLYNYMRDQGLDVHDIDAEKYLEPKETKRNER